MDQKTLLQAHSKQKNVIRKRLLEFKKSSDLFYELCFCLLTPQSSAFRCDACVKELQAKDFQSKSVENLPGILRKFTRFHNTKAKHLELMKSNWDEINRSLLALSTPFEKRVFLEKNVKGLGLKEAAHFLRNTGHQGLAILDRHILKHLVHLKVIRKIPSSLTTKQYLSIEKKFQKFSKEIKIPIDEIDLVLWSNETGKIFK